MFATHPTMAKRWAAETPSMSALPARVKKADGGALKNTWEALYRALRTESMERPAMDKRGALRATAKLEKLMPDAPKYYSMDDLSRYIGNDERRLALMPPGNFEKAAWPILSDEAQKGSEKSVYPWSKVPTKQLSNWDKSKIIGLQDMLKGGNSDIYEQAYGEGKMLPGVPTPFSDIPRLRFQSGSMAAPEWLPMVAGHEGRHRNRALDEMGVKNALVGLNSNAHTLDALETTKRFFPETADRNQWKTRNWDDVFSSRPLPFNTGGRISAGGANDYEDRFIPAYQPRPLASGGSLSARRKPDAYEDTFVPALQPIPLAEGGALDEGMASALGAGALALLNPRTRRLAALAANRAHTSFMRPRTPVGVYAESISSNLPQEFRGERLQDLRYAHAAPRSAYRNYKETLQGAWNDPKEGMQYNNLYAHEFPPTKGRVDEYLGALTPAAKLSSRLEQWGVPVQREIPRFFDMPEGSDSLMLKNVDAGALRQLAEKMKGEPVAVGHRPGNRASVFSLADQPPSIQSLREMVGKYHPDEHIKYAVSEPGRDRTLAGAEDWMGLGAHDRLLPETSRRTPSFMRSERKLLGMPDE